MTRLAIDTDYLARTLVRLLATPSPTGYTDTVVRETCAELESLGLTPTLTRRGAVCVVLRGREARPARAIVSHLDTLGAQVKQLKDNGRLELVPIGTWSARFAEGARVTVFTDRGAVRGTILPLKASGHIFNEEIDSLPIGWPMTELRVDARVHSKADLIALGIEVGDIVAIDPQPEFLANGYIVSRHLDDKAGVALMLAALKALTAHGEPPPVDVHFIFTIAEEVGVGASSALTDDVASVVAVDNGTSGPGQNSAEFGVTIAMADQTGPFDYHLTRALIRLCRDEDIIFRKDVFRYYRSDAASAVVAGHDVRNALVTFGIDASHGYERIHMHALRSVAELLSAYALSPVEIRRDAVETARGLAGFTRQPPPEPIAEDLAISQESPLA
ncbi:osmoprotectant NAGGN system M42 family peptidase [Rhodospirillum rubrum]|uniref:osmoprotectant NAGGN system M42 family peptidase n=1 Tax=Rhodospirillum rubrum TaxID=1085 RepID=UPI00190532CB|nr:osmoprotectant NAGGN system M42 family peptidase [Rhodospirillum rubrum]MBK1665640.1 osmoprotectant NAGGN system M42 family peptidase [Rhodospirillum rubrum]MBK1677722.1 osmoprotectant NAGGN system M42 family peptidase [Rhodospirillum rubrum]